LSVYQQKSDIELKRGFIFNPFIIVEVLSPATRNYDRADKFASYLRQDSLRESILIAKWGKTYPSSTKNNKLVMC